jgi:hypothetical protein
VGYWNSSELELLNLRAAAQDRLRNLKLEIDCAAEVLNKIRRRRGSRHFDEHRGDQEGVPRSSRGAAVMSR